MTFKHREEWARIGLDLSGVSDKAASHIVLRVFRAIEAGNLEAKRVAAIQSHDEAQVWAGFCGSFDRCLDPHVLWRTYANRKDLIDEQHYLRASPLKGGIVHSLSEEDLAFLPVLMAGSRARLEFIYERRGTRLDDEVAKRWLRKTKATLLSGDDVDRLIANARLKKPLHCYPRLRKMLEKLETGMLWKRVAVIQGRRVDGLSKEQFDALSMMQKTSAKLFKVEAKAITIMGDDDL